MISNQIIQNTVEELTNTTNVSLAAVDKDGRLLASTFYEGADTIIAAARKYIEDGEAPEEGNYYFFKVAEDRNLEFVVLADAEAELGDMIGSIAAFSLTELTAAYKEKHDRESFIKNLLLDNLLLVDIYNRAKKLHIETTARRVVYILEANPAGDKGIMDDIRELLGSKTGDFVTAVDETGVIIIKTLEPGQEHGQAEKTAREIMEAVKGGQDDETRIAYGTVVNEIKDISKSYKEAKMALDVGKIFFAEKDIIAYSSLCIGRLIYQLPIPLCKMFIREIFAAKSPDEFDEETINTINKFFENNLNVSETSRQLYIHRNTLVYRLDKLQKMTGLDLRVFEDAITFKIALMVVKYMKYMETMDY